MSIIGHIVRLHRILHAAQETSAHRKLDRALSEAGFPLKLAKTTMDRRAVGRSYERRREATTQALRSTVRES